VSIAAYPFLLSFRNKDGPHRVEILKKESGLTLIELMIGLVIAALSVAGVYRTFVHQQHTYVVQEQVVDMQQNARVAINQMAREIRMAGFGNVSMVLPAVIGSKTYNHILNPDIPAPGALTILSPIEDRATLSSTALIGKNQIMVSVLNDAAGAPLYDLDTKKYISIGGVESHLISSIDSVNRTITLSGNLTLNHLVGTPVFPIRAVSYQLGVESGILTIKRDENTGMGSQPLADNIENLQFEYLDSNGNPTAIPGDIRIIRVTLIARTTMQDPEGKGGDGYRRRQLATSIRVRNMDLES